MGKRFQQQSVKKKSEKQEKVVDSITRKTKFVANRKTYSFVSRLGMLVTGKDIEGNEKKFNEFVVKLTWK